ncbi:unnamed protein product [Cuscuta europaea]|uniref:Uncharacterized protein n=1 Tax=Cuscuta europaea TaxID=41803 RepID=A0A9P0YUQ3_CUSEU|nr:unnamed protein product [Cuscuta europaea]
MCFVNGLPAHYDTMASIIQQSEPLPHFYKARSMVTSEETCKNHQGVDTALVHIGPPPPPTPPVVRPGGRGRGSTRGGCGRSSPSHKGSGTPWSMPLWGYWPPPWAIPPCLYKSAPHGLVLCHHALFPPSDGIIVPHPSHAHVAIDVSNAMHTFSLTQSDDNWYLDTSASSHMTSKGGDGMLNNFVVVLRLVEKALRRVRSLSSRAGEQLTIPSAAPASVQTYFSIKS